MSVDELVEYWRYRRFCENLYLRSKYNNDSIVANCGPRQSGKSCNCITTGCIELAMGAGFSLEKNFFYGTEVPEKIIYEVTNTRMNFFGFDEAIKQAFRKRSMSSAVALFEETITQARKKNHIYFLNIPKFTTLTNAMQKDLVHFWLEIVEKSTTLEHDQGWSRVALLVRNENPILEDPWGIELLRKITRGKKNVVTTFGEKENFMRRLPTFVYTMRIPRLPKPIEDIYEPLSQASLAAWGKGVYEASVSAQKRRQEKEEPEESDEDEEIKETEVIL